MRKKILLFLAFASVFMQSCVNEDYDLNKLDTSVTLIPGLTIPVNSDFNESLSLADEVLNNSDAIIISEDGILIISESNPIEFSVKSEEIAENTRITIPESVNIPVQKALDQLFKGSKLTISHFPVIEIFNPVNYTLKLTGKAKQGEKIIEFGPFPVESGKSQIELNDERVKEFLSPVKGDITLFDMVIEGFNPKSSAPSTKGSDVYTFTIGGCLDLSLNEGDKIDFDYDFGKISKEEIQEVADEFDIDIMSCKINIEVENNSPFEFSAYASGHSSSSVVSASMDGTVKPGSIEQPIVSKISISLNLPSGLEEIDDINVAIQAVASQSPSSIHKDHTLKFKIIDIVFADGVTINFDKKE